MFRHLQLNDIFQCSYFPINLFSKLSLRQSLSVYYKHWRHEILFLSLYYSLGLVIIIPKPIVEDKFVLEIWEVLFPSHSITAVAVYLGLLFVCCAYEWYCEFAIRWACWRGEPRTCDIQFRCQFKLHLLVDEFTRSFFHLYLQKFVLKVKLLFLNLPSFMFLVLFMLFLLFLFLLFIMFFFVFLFLFLLIRTILVANYALAQIYFYFRCWDLRLCVILF